MVKTWINNETIRQRLINTNCILCLESASDYLGLSNGLLRNKITVYFTDNIEEKDIESIKMKDYNGIEYTNNGGIFCTTEEQTIIDLLRYNRDSQTIMESLANYYFKNKESFGRLLNMIPDDLYSIFKEYKIDAIEYYND